MTTIGQLFTKPVDRPIEGVIKADDAQHLATEIDEYVITNETASELSDLLETYTAPVYGGGNGVWISGFFGSGKSHLLKMLAHLLGDVPDQAYPRTEVVGQFTRKAHDAEDTMLAASIMKTATIPATALLFNIDVKANLIAKTQRDALLQVFVKVFNEARGYYSDPFVARFERDLDKNGRLDQFKAAFFSIAGKPWEQGREEGILQEHNITAAWSQVTSEPGVDDILTRYEDRYALSIEDFADEVAEWLSTQTSDHRLLFMVDEVGQFIGSEVNLMLNLQSIVEQLNTKCKGRAWVFVTSQEDMESVIGDRTKQQASDFSKIRDRFKIRMKLTSADVEEVIQKRLLGKTSQATSELADLYDAQETNFRTLFEFTDGSKTYRNYASPEHFIGVYPFVPYQFPFFQSALMGLSEHNVFEGRHASVGERSMLGVVQDVTKQLVNTPVGHVVPFDLMFSGIRSSVKSAATRNITTAEQNLPAGPNRTIAIRLLKALFLVKYVKGFNATPRNLTVLMFDQFGTDIAALHQSVTRALDLLDQETYVQRNGMVYEYLTNEEQEIEQEIKNTDVDSSDVSKLLVRIITEDVVKATTFRHQATGRDFKYEVRLDDASYSRAQPLAVHYISPAIGQTREVILAQSMGRDEVRVILADDPKLYADLKLHVQTEKYIRTRSGSSLTETQNHILESKRRLNDDRRRELIDRVRSAISNSELVVNGTPLLVSATDPEARVIEGVSQLVNRMYTNLSLLGAVTYTEQQIAGFAAEDADAIIGRGYDKLQPAADEVTTFVMNQRKLGATVTVKKIVENFEAKPYGWPLPAILCAIARLFANAKITLTLDGHLLKRTEVAEALRNSGKQANIVVSEQRQFDATKVTRVRNFAKEFFNTGDFPADPLDLASRLKDRLAEELRDVQRDREAYSQYPFISALDEPIRLLDDVQGRPEAWYLEEFTTHIDELLDAKEDAIDPIRAFLKGQQKDIYDSAYALLLANKDNLRYVPNGETDAVRTLLKDPTIFRGAGITKLREAASVLDSATNEVVTGERAKAVAAVMERWDEVAASNAYAEATDDAKAQAKRIVDATVQRINEAASVPVIRQLADDFEERPYGDIFTILETSRHQPPAVGEWDPTIEPSATQPVVVKPLVHVRNLPKPKVHVMETDVDVDHYVDELRGILHGVIADGKRISA